MDRPAVRQQRRARVDLAATVSGAVAAARLFDEHDERCTVPRPAAEAESGVELTIPDVERRSGGGYPPAADVLEPLAFACVERRGRKRRSLSRSLRRDGEAN